MAGSAEFTETMEQLKKEYTGKSPDFLPVGNGAAALYLSQKHNCSFALLTRPMTDDELHRIKIATDRLPEVTPVAINALVIITNRDFPFDYIDEDSLSRVYREGPMPLSDIYKNSKEIQSVSVYGVNSAHEFYRWFKKDILHGEPYTDRIIELKDAGEVIEKVSETPYSLGYLDSRMVSKNVKVLAIRKGNHLYNPDRDSLKNEQYPFGRYLYLYETNSSSENQKRWKNWMKSKEINVILEQNGWVAIR